jgi:hypothetical protein
MSVTFVGNAGIQLSNKDTSAVSAHANFGTLFDDGGGYTIANHNSGLGTTVDFARTFSTPKNITVNTSDNSWTHAYTGYYAFHMSYRQQSGGDIWTWYAIMKDSQTNAVGTTARMGSEDSHQESFHLIYKVDSTSSNYRIQGWSQSGTTRAITGTNANFPSGWTSSVTSIGIGKVLDIIIYRVGGL